MMRKFSIFVFFCILVFTLSSCGRAPEAQKAKEAHEREVELVMWLVGSEAQVQTINKLAKEFYEETNIRATCEAISWGEAHSKYLTSIAGDVVPDIGTMGLTWGTEFGELGAMVDLVKAYPEDLKWMKEVIFPGIWSTIEYRGKVYGIPFDMSEHVMYYRNDLIPSPPRTWEELTALLVELNKNEKGMIIDWGSMSWIGYSPFLWQAGGDYHNRDYSEVTVDSQEAVDGMAFFADLYKKYGVPKTKIPLEQGMRSGDFPIAISGSWKIQGLILGAPEIKGKWSIALLPMGPSGKSTAFIGGRVMGVFEKSKNKDEAWKFIKFLFTPKTQEMLYNEAILNRDTYLPPNINAWEALDMDPSFKAVLIRQAKDAKGPPSVLNWDSSAKFIDEAIQKVILRGADPEEEMKKAKEAIVKLLKF